METIINRVDRDINFEIGPLKILMQSSSTCSCEKWTFQCMNPEILQDSPKLLDKSMEHLFISLRHKQDPILKNAVYKFYPQEYSIVFPGKSNLVKEIWKRWDTKRLGSKARQWDGQISTLKNGPDILWLIQKIKECSTKKFPISDPHRSNGSLIC